MTRSIHRSAENDLAGAFRYYKAEAGAGIAGRFLIEFERVSQLLESNPNFGTPASDGLLWFPLKGFPYSVIWLSVIFDFFMQNFLRLFRENSTSHPYIFTGGLP